jgi:hypothetical protein
MQAGLTNIFNIACGLLGTDPISNPEEDTSLVGRNLRAHIESVAKEICQAYDFASCRARVKLQKEETLDAIPPPFSARYPLPADYLRLIEVTSELGDYSVELDSNGTRRVMFANFEPDWIIYGRVPNYDMMDPALQSAIGAALAARVAPVQAQTETRKREIKADAEAAFMGAVTAGVFERSADQPVAYTWHDRMFGG